MGDVLKNRKRRCFFGGVNACASEEGLKNRKGTEPSLQSCADSRGLASTERER